MWGPNDFYAMSAIAWAVILTLVYAGKEISDKAWIWLVSTAVLLGAYAASLEWSPFD